MENPLVFKSSLDKRPVSGELRAFLRELSALTDKLSIEESSDEDNPEAPCVRLYKDKLYTGIAFHGVPGGHEFNSFVVGLYNAAGPGQPLDPELERAVLSIQKPTSIKVLVSLSCTLCPDLVMAVQRMAALNPLIWAEAYDLNHFPALQDKHKVMSVPCLVINDQIISFGKKSISQVLELLAN
jgi:thioredoxin reductase (NADPH)